MRYIRNNKGLLFLGVCMCVWTAAALWIEPYLNCIESYRCTLSIREGTAWVEASVIGSRDCEWSSVYVCLQRKEGRKWTGVESWQDRQYGVRAAAGGTAPVVPGETYRVWMDIMVARQGRFQHQFIRTPPKIA